MTQALHVAGVAGHGQPDLVDELRARSPEAWSELFIAHHPRLYRYALTRVRSAEEADEVAAMVFARALAGIDSFRDRGKPVIAWLFGITQNVLKERMRDAQRSRAERAAGADGGVLEYGAADGGPAALSDRLDLEAAIRRLTKEQREVISLVHFGGFRAREVAAMLGKSERAVYYLEARALLKLRDELGEAKLGECK